MHTDGSDRVMNKPLGQKSYGSIGHLPGSRMGPGDHKITDGQARIATVKARDKHDRIWVQEKLDGSCCAVAKINGEIIALGRAGWRASSSKYEQHHLFDRWVRENWSLFNDLLEEGERVVGEWLAMAHGTRYDLQDRQPFVAFDIMQTSERRPLDEVYARCDGYLSVPALLSDGPTSIEEALELLGTYGYYGATDPVEGAVWRVERKDKVDFLTKFVRPDKVDGSYFNEPVWNWRP